MSQLTQLDANQVIRTVYDPNTGTLKVTGPSPIVSNLSAATDSVSIGDSTDTNFLAINADGQAPVLTSPSVVDTTTWLNSVNAGTDHTSTEVNILSYRMVGVMANWASLDQADATLQFQGSLDNVVWDNVGSATTLVAATDQQFFSLVDEPFKYMRIVYENGSVSTGTLTVKYMMRA